MNPTDAPDPGSQSGLPTGSAESVAEPALAGGPQQPLSYSERYRGTEWGAPPEADRNVFGQPANAPPRPELTRTGVAIAAVSLGIVLVMVSLVAHPFGFGLGPYASLTPTGTPRVVAPTITPTPAPGEVARQRFWTMISDPKLSYHVVASSKARGPGLSVSLDQDLDVTADSYRGTWSAPEARLRLVAIGPRIWVKVASRPWRRGTSHDPLFRIRPFMGLESIRDFEFWRPRRVGGDELYELRSTTNYQPYVGPMVGLTVTDAVCTVLLLTILVNASGVPVSADFLCEGGGRSGGHYLFVGRAHREFTKVGATFTIKPPR